MPSRKEIALVPGTLAVAQYDEISEHSAIVGLRCRLSLNLSGCVVGSANLESHTLNFSAIQVDVLHIDP